MTSFFCTCGVQNKPFLQLLKTNRAPPIGFPKIRAVHHFRTWIWVERDHLCAYLWVTRWAREPLAVSVFSTASGSKNGSFKCAQWPRWIVIGLASQSFAWECVCCSGSVLDCFHSAWVAARTKICLSIWHEFPFQCPETKISGHRWSWIRINAGVIPAQAALSIGFCIYQFEFVVIFFLRCRTTCTENCQLRDPQKERPSCTCELESPLDCEKTSTKVCMVWLPINEVKAGWLINGRPTCKPIFSLQGNTCTGSFQQWNILNNLFPN